MSEKVTHMGLTCTSNNDMDKFADRVAKFNLKQGAQDVKLTAVWTERKVPHCDEPHFDILLEYANKHVADKFWGIS